MRVVAIEEHHVIPGVSNQFLDRSRIPEAVWARLHPTVDQRLAAMDAAGIDMQVLSVVLPMPEMLPAETAVSLASRANTELQDMVAAHPDRFAAFATLPVTVPDAAAAELERTVRDLGFVGTMISGSIGGEFLDRPHFNPILDTAARLNAPIYPRSAPAAGHGRLLQRLPRPGQPGPSHRRLRVALRVVAACSTPHPQRGVRPAARPEGRPRAPRRGTGVSPAPHRLLPPPGAHRTDQADQRLPPRALLVHHQRLLLRRPVPPGTSRFRRRTADLLRGLPVRRQPTSPRLVRPPGPGARGPREDRPRHRRHAAPPERCRHSLRARTSCSSVTGLAALILQAVTG